MGEMKMEDMPLPALFEQARKIHATATESGADQEVVKKGCEALNKCEDMINKLGLFSANETKEDISTTDLKYILVARVWGYDYQKPGLCGIIFSACKIELEHIETESVLAEALGLRWGIRTVIDQGIKSCAIYCDTTTVVSRVLKEVPYYLAELTEKVAQDDRIQILKASQAKLKEFISFCEAMELVPKEELESYMQGVPKAVADQRARKIARFKRQKAAESKLLEINERKERRGRSTKAAALSTPVEAGEEELLDDDGEEEREAWNTSISLAICKAFDLLEMIKKEEEMLSAVKDRQSKDGDQEFSKDVMDERAKKAEAWHRNAKVRAQYTKPSPPITCATFAQDVLEGRAQASQAHDHKHQPLIFGPQSLVNGSFTNERERMAAQVFQPSHRMPTMSIEEAGLKEMEIMNKWQENTAKFIEEANSSWHNDRKLKPGEEEEDEDDDAAQDRARALDDWKDDNPRGAGNSKLTPCG